MIYKLIKINNKNKYLFKINVYQIGIFIKSLRTLVFIELIKHVLDCTKFIFINEMIFPKT
jgi:hypothetical protein